VGKLASVISIVAGGTGTVGEAIVKTFLQEGARVIVPSRSREAIDRLRAYLADAPTERLTTLLGNIADVHDAQRLRDEIVTRFDHYDSVVAALGGTWEDKLNLVDVPMETWQKYWESNLTPHFVAARTLLPPLANRAASSYTLVGGLSAVMPIAKYSVVSINSAAQLMLAKVLIEEMKDARVRINQVMFGVVHTRARAAYARPEWVTADEVGSFCAYLASREASMVNGGIIQLGNRPPVS
jgi:NAD(P)-dependent dehydrogenase (short-subunit alcohol dehydrogenase family)